MKIERGWIIGLLSIVLIIGYACQEDETYTVSPEQDQALSPQKTEGEVPSLANHSSDGHVQNFRTHLSGDNEVPAVETNAQGEAIFQVSSDGESISYKLIVANIEDVRMAHIHLAPPGENGGVVVWLYPDSPPPVLIEGRFDGVLAEGTITADDLVGALEGGTLDDLLDEITSDNAYVNVHTIANPGGEIRGQIH